MCVQIKAFRGDHLVQVSDAQGHLWSRLFTGCFSGFRARKFAMTLDTSF